MIAAFSSDAVRASEAPLLAAGVDLMGQAAFAASRVILEQVRARGAVAGARVVVLVGSGNNGGDGLWAGAFLARRGVSVLAILASEQVHAAGLAALHGAGGESMPLVGPRAVWRGEAIAEAFSATVIVDALLGIGARGRMRAPEVTLLGPLVDLLAADDSPSRPLVVAVDLPSGMGVDDGTLPGVVLPADVTVTFGAVKPGLLLPPAAAAVGELVSVDIGLDLTDTPVLWRLEEADVAGLWPVPGPRDHKYTRGVVGVVAGAAQFPGAAVLVVAAAVRCGAGLVRYLGPARAEVIAARPEAVCAAGTVDAWVLGSGVDPHEVAQADAIAAILLTAAVPVVVDAGALEVLVRVLDRLPDPVRRWLVLTPHAGELASVLTALGRECSRAQVEASPLEHARACAELTGATVVLKGSTTVIVSPAGMVFSQADGVPQLATAGSGDVLAGTLGALLGQLHSGALAGGASADQGPAFLLAQAAAAGVLVHGRAGALAAGDPPGPIAALDVVAALPRVLATLP